MFLLNLFMHNGISQPAVYIIKTWIVHFSYKVFVVTVFKNCIFLNFHESRKNMDQDGNVVRHLILEASVRKCPIIRI